MAKESKSNPKKDMADKILKDVLKKKKDLLPIEQNIKNSQEHHLRGEGLAYSMRGDFESAIECCNRAIKINPKGAYSYFLRGRSKGDLGYLEEGLKDLTKAIKLDNTFADAYTNRGIIRSKLEDYEGAISDLNRAIELDPKDLEALRQRGLIKGLLGDPKGAILDFKKAIKVKPDKHHYISQEMIDGLKECLALAEKMRERDELNA